VKRRRAKNAAKDAIDLSRISSGFTGSGIYGKEFSMVVAEGRAGYGAGAVSRRQERVFGQWSVVSGQ
jgi:hypothetical protein